MFDYNANYVVYDQRKESDLRFQNVVIDIFFTQTIENIRNNPPIFE